MPKHLIRRITPDHDTVRNHRHLQIFGKLLHDPNLWHLNRRSASGAFAIGLFMAFVPVPFQMVLAAAAAIPFRVNLPLSVALVWITNPITMPAIFYFAYLVGTWVIGQPPQDFEFQLSFEWLGNELASSWKPFLTGCFLLATTSSIIGYFTVSQFWIYAVKKQRSRRKGNPL